MLLADADEIEAAASVERPEDLYPAQLAVFQDPHHPKVIEQARKDGVPEADRRGAEFARLQDGDWKVAFPLHPEYRTLPMVVYVPLADQRRGQQRAAWRNGAIPDVSAAHTACVRQPAYGGDEAREARPRAHARDARLSGPECRSTGIPGDPEAGPLPLANRRDVSHQAIANYEDRFVIPTTHREHAEDAYDLRGSCGFSLGNGCPTARAARACSAASASSRSRRSRQEQGAACDGGIAVLSGRGADRGLPEIKAFVPKEVIALTEELACKDLYSLQEQYVSLFDRSRALSLHLFEHARRDRLSAGKPWSSWRRCINCTA